MENEVISLAHSIKIIAWLEVLEKIAFCFSASHHGNKSKEDFSRIGILGLKFFVDFRKFSQNPVKIQLEFSQSAAKIQINSDKIQSKSSQNPVKNLDTFESILRLIFRPFYFQNLSRISSFGGKFLTIFSLANLEAIFASIRNSTAFATKSQGKT